MKFPMLHILIVFVLAVLLCAFLLPTGMEAGKSLEMSKFDSGLVLGVAEELHLGQYDISQVSLGHKPLPKNEYIIPETPKFIGNEQPEIADCKGAILDEESGTILYDKNADEITPIASITKLMTALVFLENNPGWETEYSIKKNDYVGGGMVYLAAGNTVTVKDLFYTGLVGSANTATMALAHSTGLNTEEFVNKMNEKALSMGLVNSRFADPVGISIGNISTAKEVVMLAKAALENEHVSLAVGSEKYEYNTKEGLKKAVKSTNVLLYSIKEGEIMNIGGKTGFTNAAGYCFVGKFRNDEGKELISVILGGPSINSRFALARNLSEWAFSNYVW